MRALRESLRGEPIRRIMGIVNGTTNYILTKMTEQGAAYGEALAEAQDLGFAERDPTADVEGFDAGAKAAIMASIAFGAKVVAGDVYHEGISNVTPADIDVARRLGYVVKLLAIAELDDAERRDRRARAPGDGARAPPAGQRARELQRRVVEGDAVGQLMFYGRGAGGLPTASAVLGDVIDAAVNLTKGTHGTLGSFAKARIRPIDETSAEYLLGLEVADEPGVLHAVTGVFADHGVSIRAAEQEGIGADARLVFITHEARESAIQATVHGLRELAVVRHVGGLLRVIGELSDVRYVSTRGRAPELGFADVLLAGLATDGGLYVPAEWPLLPTPAELDAAGGYADDGPPGHHPVRRRRHRARRPGPDVRRGLRHVPPPGRRAARADRPPAVAGRAVPRTDAGVQGRRPAARRAAVRPRARRPPGPRHDRRGDERRHRVGGDRGRARLRATSTS